MIKKSEKLFKFNLFVLPFFCLIITYIVYSVPSINHNSQQEYCIYTANKFPRSKEPERTYIYFDNKYVQYNPSIHKDIDVFYLKQGSLDINSSNWGIDGNPCVLKTSKVLKELLVLSAVLYVFLFFLTNLVKLFLKKD